MMAAAAVVMIGSGCGYYSCGGVSWGELMVGDGVDGGESATVAVEVWWRALSGSEGSEMMLMIFIWRWVAGNPAGICPERWGGARK
ncbi:hypothetical protein Tco_1438891 [Tanacetum coccineum]